MNSTPQSASGARRRLQERARHRRVPARLAHQQQPQVVQVRSKYSRRSCIVAPGQHAETTGDDPRRHALGVRVDRREVPGRSHRRGRSAGLTVWVMYLRTRRMCSREYSSAVRRVALADRFVDHPVLGDVDPHPARVRQRVVAKPPPQRLVHDRRELVADRDHDRVAGHHSDLAVKHAVGLRPDRPLIRAGRVRQPLHLVQQPLGERVAAGAVGRDPGDRGLERLARLQQRERAGVRGPGAPAGTPRATEPWRRRPRTSPSRGASPQSRRPAAPRSPRAPTSGRPPSGGRARARRAASARGRASRPGCPAQSSARSARRPARREADLSSNQFPRPLVWTLHHFAPRF